MKIAIAFVLKNINKNELKSNLHRNTTNLKQQPFLSKDRNGSQLSTQGA